MINILINSVYSLFSCGKDSLKVNCWTEIFNLVGRTIKTIKQGKLFDIVGVSEKKMTIYVHSSRKERHICRNEIEDAYEHFMTNGEITRTEIEDQSSPRNPAYVVAILGSLPEVKIKSRNPIRISRL